MFPLLGRLLCGNNSEFYLAGPLALGARHNTCGRLIEIQLSKAKLMATFGAFVDALPMTRPVRLWRIWTHWGLRAMEGLNTVAPCKVWLLRSGSRLAIGAAALRLPFGLTMPRRSFSGRARHESVCLTVLPL